jgi:hypothetical protein
MSKLPSKHLNTVAVVNSIGVAMASRATDSAPEPDFADDLLRGAAEIAMFLFNDPLGRRKVFHLANSSKLPFFKLGGMICARRSVLLKWIKDQEERYSRACGKRRPQQFFPEQND